MIKNSLFVYQSGAVTEQTAVQLTVCPANMSLRLACDNSHTFTVTCLQLTTRAKARPAST